MSAENYVYKKEVDWSLFNYGLNIPIQHQVKFKQIAGRFIERGESKPITLYLNGSSYKARLNNLKIDAKYGNHADMVQIRYSGNSDIANALRGCFNRSYAYIKRIKDSKGTWYLYIMNGKGEIHVRQADSGDYQRKLRQ